MGDHADDAMNDAMDWEDARTDYVTGSSTFDEAYDAGVIDEYGVIYKPVPSKSLGTCRYCHKPNLEWRDTQWGKRLFDDGKPHTCPEYRQQRESNRPRQTQDDLVPELRKLTESINRLYTATSSLRDEMNRFYNAKYGQ